MSRVQQIRDAIDRRLTRFRVVGRRTHVRGGIIAAATLAFTLVHPGPRPLAVEQVSASAARLEESDLWLVPSTPTRLTQGLGDAVANLAAGHAREALPVFRRATADPVLGGYARLYLGRAQLALDDAKAAQATAQTVVNAQPGGYLGEAALWLVADAAEANQAWSDAETALHVLTGLRSTNPALAYLRLGRAAVKLHDVDLARASFTTAYYDFPLTNEANDAGDELRALPDPTQPEPAARDVDRAQALYGAGRYDDARKAFAAVRDRVTGDDRDRVDLRLAECDFYRGQYAASRRSLDAYLAGSPARRLEAEFYVLGTSRQLGHEDEYLRLVRAFVDANPVSALAERALNELGTYFIIQDEDQQAADTFTEMYRRFPRGAYADRAAWKAGWWAYRQGNYRETIRLFDDAVANLGRADYRPAWLYWAGRAHAQLGERDAAIAAYRQVVADYRNSYYGRLATKRLGELVKGGAEALPVVARDALVDLAPGAPPDNAPLVRALMGAGLYDDAVFELRKTQAESGSSPFIQATIANALYLEGSLRPAISAMRRAYPQFLAAGGEALPESLLTVIFPRSYWDLIRKFSTARHLDPYLMTALIAQESTFQADVRSAANAWGLMQIVPATGRRYARQLRIKRFTTRALTQPDVNVRIGMAYFADLVTQFGDPALALAAYNAGESRVVVWRAERPGLDRDEFIDDIPFPETQNYVKRILGTAEDYRVLYGSEHGGAPRSAAR
jgi:soluble lytic murein transglycosylase